MEASAQASPTGRRRVAVYGGSFNPPHVAHVLAVVYALSTQPIDEVLVVPVYQHPFAKELAPFDDRLEMCRLALGWIPNVTIATVERELGGESRTLRTIEHLVATHPERAFRLLVGADVLADLPKWHRWDRIAELAPPIVLGRSGASIPADVSWAPHPHAGAPADVAPSAPAPRPMLPQVSSTEIRAVIGAGGLRGLDELVPASVLAYIEERGLYGARGA